MIPMVWTCSSCTASAIEASTGSGSTAKLIARSLTRVSASAKAEIIPTMPPISMASSV